ncbi:hypothetical protein OHA17_00665 [Streptomyces sp. NBC_00212]
MAELAEIVVVNDIRVPLRPASASPRGHPVTARSQLATPAVPTALAHPRPHPLFLDHRAQGDGQEGPGVGTIENTSQVRRYVRVLHTFNAGWNYPNPSRDEL